MARRYANDDAPTVLPSQENPLVDKDGLSIALEAIFTKQNEMESTLTNNIREVTGLVQQVSASLNRLRGNIDETLHTYEIDINIETLSENEIDSILESP